MGKELGRISGPLLSANLLRNGNNLVFDSNLLFLNVGNKRLGVNTLGPSRDLTIANTTDTTNLLVDTQSEIANFVITTNQIQDPLGTITISPAQSSPVITTPGLATSLLEFSGNTLLNATSGSNIELTPSGSGVTNIRNSVNVYGNLHATGNITWDGNIQLGNDASDTITFASEVGSSIVPSITDSYDLGSATIEWNNLRSATLNSNLINGDLVNSSTVNIGNIRATTNTISNINPATDITITTDGSGLTYFNGRNYVNTNQIPVATTLTLNNTANGYVKFDGTFGVVIPQSHTEETLGIETGTLRFYPDLGYAKIFNGTGWQPVGGISEVLTQGQVTDVMWAWDLILG